MAREFKEVAHLRTNIEKYSSNYDSIDWNHPATPDSSQLTDTKKSINGTYTDMSIAVNNEVTSEVNNERMLVTYCHELEKKVQGYIASLNYAHVVNEELDARLKESEETIKMLVETLKGIGDYVPFYGDTWARAATNEALEKYEQQIKGDSK